MLKTDSIIRPRKIAAMAESKKIANGVPIFKINEIDMRANASQLGYSSDFNNLYNKKNKAKQGQKSVQGKVMGELENYCEKSTLHGLRYVGDPSLTFCERIFWLMSFSVAIGFAGFYITNIYAKWNSSPVIISFSPFDAQLKDIPFPAVTICNMNQAKKTEVIKIKSDGNPKDLKLLDDICNSNETSSNSSEPTSYNWTNLRNFLIRVGNSCSDMLRVCMWSNNVTDCSDMFNNDLTDEGLCCSFNRLPPKYIFRNPSEVSLQLNQTYSENVYDWTPESGFPEFYNDSYVPKRPLGAGAHLGLTIVLDAQIDEYYCSSTSSIGFKIIIGNPIETPKMADYGTLLSPGVEARFSIKPSVREASPNLRSIPVDKRQCYFANERKLVYYRVYSKQNCLLECASMLVFKSCGCIPYFLPKDDDMPSCEQKDEACVAEAQAVVLKENQGKLSCNCYNQCSTVVYNMKGSFGKLKSSVDRSLNLQTITNNTDDHVVLHFFFNEDRYEKIMKDRLYDTTDLIANTGGLLGVFLGFSILSCVEIFYTFAGYVVNYISQKWKNHLPFVH